MHTTPTCSTASSPKGSSSCSESIQTDSPAITKSSRLKLPGSTKKKPSGSSLSKLSGTGSKPEVRKSGSSKSELTKTKSKKSGSKKFPKTVYPRISADGSVVPDFQFDLDPIPLKPRTSRSSSNSSSNWLGRWPSVEFINMLQNNSQAWPIWEQAVNSEQKIMDIRLHYHCVCLFFINTCK